jgi:hypothetical protein
MLAMALCIVAFGIGLVLGRRSLVAGIGAALSVGYVYGITRANITGAAAHFIFDAAVLGLYAAQLLPRRPNQQRTSRALTVWLWVLMAWPVLLFALPLQDPLIQLVGLRGNIFLLPFLALGSRLADDELKRLAKWCAVLNLAAFGVAVAQFFIGLEPFYPVNALTAEMIYARQDVANGAFRIPSTFGNAHAFSGTMVCTLPLLFGAWAERPKSFWQRTLLTAALVATLVAVFMAAARVHMVVMFLVLLVSTLPGRLRLTYRISWTVALLVVGLIVSQDERLQRFTTLQDTGFVAERIGASNREDFIQLIASYPLGNGLGAGGTSIPYFLQNRVQNPLFIENEYSRILLEQGVPGLLAWIGFVIWAFGRKRRRSDPTWRLGRRLAWFTCLAYFASGLIGVGLLTAVPQSALLLLLLGRLTGYRPLRATLPEVEVSNESAETWDLATVSRS